MKIGKPHKIPFEAAPCSEDNKRLRGHPALGFLLSVLANQPREAADVTAQTHEGRRSTTRWQNAV